MVTSVTPLHGAEGVKVGYPTPASSAAVVRNMVAMAGLPIGALGQLVGVKHYHHTYRWLTGERRPSALILNRFLELLYLKNAQGIRLATIESIDWNTGIITLFDGTERRVMAQEPNDLRKGWTIG